MSPEDRDGGKHVRLQEHRFAHKGWLYKRKETKGRRKNIKIDYRFFEHFRIDEHQSAAFGFTLDFASEIL
jgi:hypothetical protein